jgi:hypothetical protein
MNLYKQVFIKVTGDLPEEGSYVCVLKNGSPCCCSYELNNILLLDFWMENVEYYFQALPVEQMQVMKVTNE